MQSLNSFADLKAVGKALQKKAREEAEQRKLANAKKEKQLREARTFADAMKSMGVEPLKQNPVANKKGSPKKPFAKSGNMPERDMPAAALSDGNDSLAFVQSDDGRSYWRQELSQDICRKLIRGDWAVDARLDLHGLTLTPARSAAFEFIKKAEKSGFRCVKIVHGKGYGSPDRQSVLKDMVRRWLKQCDSVMAFAQPLEKDGGAGALLVLLRTDD